MGLFGMCKYFFISNLQQIFFQFFRGCWETILSFMGTVAATFYDTRTQIHSSIDNSLRESFHT